MYHSPNIKKMPDRVNWMFEGNDVFVSSWRPDRKYLRIVANDSVYNLVDKGDAMVIETRAGAFGIEYHVH
jgi:hypothetical protein